MLNEDIHQIFKKAANSVRKRMYGLSGGMPNNLISCIDALALVYTVNEVSVNSSPSTNIIAESESDICSKVVQILRQNGYISFKFLPPVTDLKSTVIHILQTATCSSDKDLHAYTVNDLISKLYRRANDLVMRLELYKNKKDDCNSSDLPDFEGVFDEMYILFTLCASARIIGEYGNFSDSLTNLKNIGEFIDIIKSTFSSLMVTENTLYEVMEMIKDSYGPVVQELWKNHVNVCERKDVKKIRDASFSSNVVVSWCIRAWVAVWYHTLTI